MKPIGLTKAKSQARTANMKMNRHQKGIASLHGHEKLSLPESLVGKGQSPSALRHPRHVPSSAPSL